MKKYFLPIFYLLLTCSINLYSQDSKLQAGLSLDIDYALHINSSNFPILISTLYGENTSKFFGNFGANAEVLCFSKISIRYEIGLREEKFEFFDSEIPWLENLITSDCKYLTHKLNPMWKINAKDSPTSTWFSIGIKSSQIILQQYSFLSSNKGIPDSSFHYLSMQHRFYQLSLNILLSRESTLGSSRFIFYREIHFNTIPVITHKNNIPAFNSPEIGISLAISYNFLRRK
jgi:hypothetical protein